MWIDSWLFCYPRELHFQLSPFALPELRYYIMQDKCMSKTRFLTKKTDPCKISQQSVRCNCKQIGHKWLGSFLFQQLKTLIKSIFYNLIDWTFFFFFCVKKSWKIVSKSEVFYLACLKLSEFGQGVRNTLISAGIGKYCTGSLEPTIYSSKTIYFYSIWCHHLLRLWAFI